jgi:AraC-like DNA-binding protein
MYAKWAANWYRPVDRRRATMDQEKDSKPLDSFPMLRSQNIEEIRQALIQSYGARRFDRPHSAEEGELRVNLWQSQHVALAYISGTPFQLEFPSGDFFRQAFVRGTADIRFDRVERQVTEATCVVPPDALVTTTFASGFEHFGLRIKTDSLLGKLAALIGGTPSRKLVFDQTINSSAIGNLRRMLTFFAAELDSTVSALAVTELEQALIVSFICNNRHNYSTFLEDRTRPIASWQLRRAEEYIEAHWDQPITIEDLVRETSSSARSLFRQFSRSRGQSPMAFLKDVRLRHARRMLQQTDRIRSVTEIAVDCGFGNLGHFARDYFKRFGERPSDALRRKQGGIAAVA